MNITAAYNFHLTGQFFQSYRGLTVEIVAGLFMYA